jgi:hypothetical protein
MGAFLFLFALIADALLLFGAVFFVAVDFT